MLPIILLLGPCGCRKGTIAKQLSTQYNLYHLAVGDWLRAQTKSTIAVVPDEINEYVTKSLPIPRDLLIAEYGAGYHDAMPPALNLYVCNKLNISTPSSMWIKALPAFRAECTEISPQSQCTPANEKYSAILLDNFPQNHRSSQGPRSRLRSTLPSSSDLALLPGRCYDATVPFSFTWL